MVTSASRVGSSRRRAALVATCLAALAASCDLKLVSVENACNDEDATTGLGAVEYDYDITRSEITSGEYARFLNKVAKDDPHGLYDARMGSDSVRGGIDRLGSPGSYTYSTKVNFANKPVNYVSWLNALRFVNYQENGEPQGPQGAGTTENGTYDLSLAPGAIVRKPGSHWVLPSENEWYKAAYHDPTKAGEYWTYPTRSDIEPTMATCDASGNVLNPGANVANYLDGCVWNGSGSGLDGTGNVSRVGGAAETSESMPAPGASFYNTVDQGGNVFEWTEAFWPASESFRAIRGGSFDLPALFLRSDESFPLAPTSASWWIGFRVAQVLPCWGEESDGDGVPDPCDNCSLVANPTQLDADHDGYGNLCDCDLNQDSVCGFPDFNACLACLGQSVPGSGPPEDPQCRESDMDGDGTVEQEDCDRLGGLFPGPPGPGGAATDPDADGVAQDVDNCLLEANATQLDADSDDYGSHCDCDYDQNGICAFADFTIFLICNGQAVPGSGPADDPTCAESDMNGDGFVGDADFQLFLKRFGQAPGPKAGEGRCIS